MDNTLFRTNFPEFSDATKYPDSMLTYWGTVAEIMVIQCIWKKMWPTGVSLYVAHQITLAAQNAKAGAIGGTPGISGGVPNTKTVGSVTVGFDSVVTSETGAGFWNLTNYGKQFYHLVQIFGAGCIQL